MNVIDRIEQIVAQSDFISGVRKEIEYKQDCDGNYQPEKETYVEVDEITKLDFSELLHLAKLGAAVQKGIKEGCCWPCPPGSFLKDGCDIDIDLGCAWYDFCKLHQEVQQCQEQT